MAISHIQLLFLFASLFFLPSALGTALGYNNCPLSKTYKGDVKVNKVEMIPYPIKFHDNPVLNITGTTSVTLTAESTLITFRKTVGRPLRTSVGRRYKLGDITKGPIAPGTFVITLANAFAAQNSDIYELISGETEVTLEISNKEGAGIPANMCAHFFFDANAMVKFRNSETLHRVKVNRVEIFPFTVNVKDNPVFRIAAYTPKDIPSSAIVVASMGLVGSRFAPKPVTWKRVYKLCESSYHCPIKTGHFVLAVPHPYGMDKKKAGEYIVTVKIKNLTNYVFMDLAFNFWVTEALSRE